MATGDIFVRRRAAALALVAALGAAHVAAQEPQGPAEVQLELHTSRQVLQVGEKIDFAITVRNIGTRPLLLNGGGTLPDGQQIWAAVSCRLAHPERGFVPLMLRWGGPVKGRVDFLGIPLEPGDSHTLPVESSKYSYGLPKRVQAGHYFLSCTFTSGPFGSQPYLTRGSWSTERVPIEFTP